MSLCLSDGVLIRAACCLMLTKILTSLQKARHRSHPTTVILFFAIWPLPEQQLKIKLKTEHRTVYCAVQKIRKNLQSGRLVLKQTRNNGINGKADFYAFVWNKHVQNVFAEYKICNNDVPLATWIIFCPWHVQISAWTWNILLQQMSFFFLCLAMNSTACYCPWVHVHRFLCFFSALNSMCHILPYKAHPQNTRCRAML